MPAVSSRSFTPYGIPWSGPRYFPAAISTSACLACASAASRVGHLHLDQLLRFGEGRRRDLGADRWRGVEGRRRARSRRGGCRSAGAGLLVVRATGGDGAEQRDGRLNEEVASGVHFGGW